MVLQYYENFLGIKSLNSEAKRFVVTSFNFHWVFTTLVWLTNTFLILYTLDNIHQNLSQAYVELAILVSIQVLVQILVDYPTGVLGDWIGHRWVLALSAVTYGLSYIIISIIPLTFETTIAGARIIDGQWVQLITTGPEETTRFVFLIAYILLAVAASQESGAFDSWFQNNYKVYAPEDADRKVFTELAAKKEVSLNIIVTVTIAVSGFLVVTIGHELLFFLQGILFAITPLLIFKIIRDHPSVQREEAHFELRGYFELLKEGFLTIGRNRVLLLFVIGSAIFASVGAVWFNLMLFPVYEKYALNEARLGLLRACIYAVSAFILFLFGVFSKKIKNVKRWMIIFALLQAPTLFGLLYIMLQFFPLTKWGYVSSIQGFGYGIIPFTWLRFYAVIIFFSIAVLPYAFFQILSARFYLDVIPDKNRNSVYSLIPTVIAIATIFTIRIGGDMIKDRGRGKIWWEYYSNITKIYQSMLLVLFIMGLAGSLIIAFAIYLYEPSKVPVPPIYIPQNRFLAGINALIPYTIPSPLEVKPTDMDYFYYWPLVGTALADGEISNEERKLLVSILANLKEYAKILEKATKDNIISPAEKEELTVAREKLWKEAHRVAIEKDGISDAENRILTKLLEVIRSLESEEGQ